jgi:diaminopimelate decarboxylase
MAMSFVRNVDQPADAPSPMPLSLPALRHRDVERLLGEHHAVVRELVDGLGSPLHLVLPHLFDDTVRRFERVMADARVEGRLSFAKKSNKARCFVQRAAALGIGVDAASLAELQGALAVGVPGEHVGVTGPAKSAELIELALRQRCCIAIDGPAELALVEALAVRARVEARVLLRCRPDLPGQARSRFGMTPDERAEALARCARSAGRIELEGFAFHLTGYSPSQRAEMASLMIDRCLEARQLGMRADSINIGGGFSVQYVAPADWQRFLGAHTPGHYHADKTFSGFYPYGSVNAGAAMLAEILATPVDGTLRLSDKLARSGTRLLLEPGRALLDQAGLTAFRIQGVKDRRSGDSRYAILTAEGTSFSLSEQWFNSEYLPDPILLGGRAQRASAPFERAERSFDACVGGASCLDSDMLTWRKIPFPRAVEVGDVLVYVNTAGYQMDSNESPFHDLPLPRKVVIGFDGPRVRWRLDDVAEPLFLPHSPTPRIDP